MKLDRRVKEGAVIQVNEKVKGYRGCLMIVDKRTPDGIKCYMRLPNRGESAIVLPCDAVHYIGESAYTLLDR